MPYKDPKSPEAVASAKRAQKKYYGTPKHAARRARHQASQTYRDTLATYRSSEAGVRSTHIAKLNYRGTPKGFFKAIRDRALGHSVEFTLTEEEGLALLAPMRCSITGMPLEIRPTEPRYLLSPSFDRLDGAKGYVPGNVQLVALWANLARGSAPLEEFRAVLTAFKEQPDGR